MMLSLGLELTQGFDLSLFVKFDPRNAVKLIDDAVVFAAEVPFHTQSISAFKHILDIPLENAPSKIPIGEPALNLGNTEVLRAVAFGVNRIYSKDGRKNGSIFG